MMLIGLVIQSGLMGTIFYITAWLINPLVGIFFVILIFHGILLFFFVDVHYTLTKALNMIILNVDDNHTAL